MKPPIVLDACCGARLFWFDRKDSRALFMDRREGKFSKDRGTPKTKGRKPVVIAPDLIADFTKIPFRDEAFSLVVFDPPHHTTRHLSSSKSIIRQTYGVLEADWRQMLQKGFEECFRVLRPEGVLIFKWGSREIPLKRVLELTPHKPLFGHQTVRNGTTHWVAFIKS